MPTIWKSELYTGAPRLLADAGPRHSLGWQDNRKAGPSFVIARNGLRGKVTQRFPLTEPGWEDAWQALLGLDSAAAEAMRPILAKREARSHAALALTTLNTASLCSLRSVPFNGGSGSDPLVKGQLCDLRFLTDKIVVCPPGSADPILEMPYRDLESVDISGPDSTRSGSDLQVVVVLVLALLGALLGLLILGFLGFVLGALIFGLIGAMVGSSFGKVETTVRIRGRDAEYYFLTTLKRPDALRMEMSEALRAIDKARAARPADPDDGADSATEPIPEQLSRLASLLEQGLITRDEFEHLKARLIAQS
jgi:hypothetical protein